MAGVEKLLAQMRSSPTSIRFADLVKVCDHYFGEARQSGTSHRVYRTPWQGNPRVNIRSKNGQAKPYRVGQVLNAIDKILEEGKP